MVEVEIEMVLLLTSSQEICFMCAAVKQILTKFPGMIIVTTEVHPVTPNHFGQRYFGTD